MLAIALIAIDYWLDVLVHACHFEALDTSNNKEYSFTVHAMINSDPIWVMNNLLVTNVFRKVRDCEVKVMCVCVCACYCVLCCVV